MAPAGVLYYGTVSKPGENEVDNKKCSNQKTLFGTCTKKFPFSFFWIGNNTFYDIRVNHIMEDRFFLKPGYFYLTQSRRDQEPFLIKAA
jgi:hypothetical protein